MTGNHSVERAEDLIVVLSTVGKKEQAEEIAVRLIDQRLAACVQVEGPVLSHYRWEGQVENSEEYRLVIKSTSSLETQLYQVLADVHPYEVPQIVTLAMTGGLPAYVDWVREETGSGVRRDSGR